MCGSRSLVSSAVSIKPRRLQPLQWLRELTLWGYPRSDPIQWLRTTFKANTLMKKKKAFVSCNIVSSLSLVGFNVAFGNLIVCFLKNVRVWVLVHVCENQSGKVLFRKLLIMFYTHLLPHNKRPCCLPCVLFKFESPPVLSLSNCSYYYETRKNYLVSTKYEWKKTFGFSLWVRRIVIAY